MSKIVLEPKGEPDKRPHSDSADMKAVAFDAERFNKTIVSAHEVLSREGFIKRGKSTLKHKPLPASAWADKYWLLIRLVMRARTTTRGRLRISRRICEMAKVHVGMTWTDTKGRAWEVVERLPFGKFRVRTTDRTRVGEMRGSDIEQVAP